MGVLLLRRVPSYRRIPEAGVHAVTKLSDVIIEGQRRLNARRPYADTHDGSPHGSHVLGLVAEYFFAERYGFEVNLEDRPAGDGGADFVLTDDVFTFRVNIQGRIARRPLDICLQAGKAGRCEIHVLLELVTEPYRVTGAWWCFESGILDYCPEPRPPLKPGMGWAHMLPVERAARILGTPMDEWFMKARQRSQME